MRIFKKLLTLLDIIVSRIIHELSYFAPRDKNLWIFIGWHGNKAQEIFADNTKYLFLYTHKNLLNHKAVWIAKDSNLSAKLKERGYNAHTYRSIKGVWYSLRAGYTFLDAYLQRENFRYTKGTKLIQLLHGRILKKHGYGKKQFSKYDFIFGPSKFSINLLPQSFRNKSELIVSGYPRCSTFFQNIKDADLGTNQKLLNNLKKIKKNPNEKSVLYMPTFRRNTENFDINNILNPELLSSFLVKENAHFFIKLHPKFTGHKYTTLHQNIYFMEESDMYPLLPYFDIFVTDYSSIFGDLLLLHRPIILYPYDLVQYEKKEGFILDYNKYMPGPRAYTPEKLILRLKESLSDQNLYFKKQKQIKKLYHQYEDGRASERISEVLLEKISH